jgi:hypothetical protein
MPEIELTGPSTAVGVDYFQEQVSAEAEDRFR